MDQRRLGDLSEEGDDDTNSDTDADDYEACIREPKACKRCYCLLLTPYPTTAPRITFLLYIIKIII